MTREPDPEQDRSAMQRLDARHYGDPEDDSIVELSGIAPPCECCQERQAAGRLNGRDLCDPCRRELADDLEAPGSVQESDQDVSDSD